jgi:hypothetical protein
VQRDQVLEMNLAHAANAKRAKSQPFAIHVKDSIGRNRSRPGQTTRPTTPILRDAPDVLRLEIQHTSQLRAAHSLRWLPGL